MPPRVMTKPKAAVLPDRDHLEGCPARRIESFTAKHPKTGAALVIVRCVDCGGSTVNRPTSASALEADEDESESPDGTDEKED